jgi:hypothetical protein
LDSLTVSSAIAFAQGNQHTERADQAAHHLRHFIQRQPMFAGPRQKTLWET